MDSTIAIAAGRVVENLASSFVGLSARPNLRPSGLRVR